MRNRIHRFVNITVVLMLAFACSMCAVNAATSKTVSVKTATGKVNSSDGAFIREKASTESTAIYCADDNAKLTILKEVFVKKTSTKKQDRWYQVTIKDKTGYIRSDLVDTIAYTAVKGKTTDELNYRKGPGTKFSSAGTLKKGKSVSIVLKANVKGSGIWYKIKKNSKYYYVSKSYVKLTSSTSSSSSSKDTDKDKVTVSVTGESLPTTVGLGSSFPLKGEVTANKTIDKVKFGITNTKGSWLPDFYKEVKVDNTTFNIADIDQYIKFGELSTGTYKYVGVVYVGSKGYTVVEQTFKVVKLKGPDIILATALKLAWPYGTPESVYSGSPSSNYQSAVDALGYKGKLNDCSMFVRTVLVYSGYDKTYPGDITKQWTYLAESDKWIKVQTANENYALESELLPGDVIIYRKGASSWHTCIYAGKIDGCGCIAEASRTLEYYGFIRKGVTKITKTTDKELFAAYRAAS